MQSGFSMTEPDHAGSDPRSIETEAVRDGDDWVINGHKWFTSNGIEADFFIVMCRANDPTGELGAPGRMTQIIVPTATKGVNIIRGIGIFGHSTSDHCEIRYENVRVPVENTLGLVGQGHQAAQDRLGAGRVYHCMNSVGQMWRAFDLMVERTLVRQVHGGLLKDKQFIQGFIADSYMDVQSARLMTINAAEKVANGDPDVRTAISAIKVFVPAAYHRVVDRAIQVWGGAGVSNDLPLGQMYLTARVLRLADGPDEVHKILMAKNILHRYEGGDSWNFGNSEPTARGAAAGEQSSGVRARLAASGGRADTRWPRWKTVPSGSDWRTMPPVTAYTPGTPSWVDLASADLAASASFYSTLFGWDAVDQGEEAGHYHLFELNGVPVAGAGPIMMEGQPPAWTTYVSVEDADASIAKVAQAGGTVFVEPMDVLDVGRMAVFADSTGAAAAVWQPATHIGAGLVNEPGALAWNELNTRDAAAAKTFYGAVFGWEGETGSMGEMEYTEWKLGGVVIGGMLAMPGRGPRRHARPLVGLLRDRRYRCHRGDGDRPRCDAVRGPGRHPRRPVRRPGRPGRRHVRRHRTGRRLIHPGPAAYAAAVDPSLIKQQRSLVTELPGPKSRALALRRSEAVAPGVSSTLPLYVAEASGAILVDVDGNALIDLGSGIAVVSVGHAAPAVVDAVREQAGRFSHTCFMVNPYEGYVAVCEELNDLAPGDHPSVPPCSTRAPRRSRTR